MYNPYQYWTTRGRTYLYEEHEGDKERGEEIEKAVKMLKPSCLLEVGCGPGKYFESHRSSCLTGVPISSRVALDFSSTALAFASLHHGDRAGCGLIQQDACQLGFRDGTFDLSFTCAVLVHIPTATIEEAIKEICRVTKTYVLIMEYWDPKQIIKELAPHCFRHNYPLLFRENGFTVEEHRQLQALIGLFLLKKAVWLG